MAILIRDAHLERQVKAEAERRGHGTMARTVTALLIERLTQLDNTRNYDGTPLVRTGPGGEYVQNWPDNKESK